MRRLTPLSLLALAGCHIVFGHAPGAGDRAPALDLARSEASSDRSLLDLPLAEASLGDKGGPSDKSVTLPDKGPSLDKGPKLDQEAKLDKGGLADKAVPDKGAPDQAVLAPGSVLWSRVFDGTLDEEGLGIAHDSGGKIFVTGYTKSALTAGGAPLPNLGGEEIFLVGLDGAGKHLCSKSYGSTANDRGLAITTTANGAYVVGTLGGAATIASVPLSSHLLFEAKSCAATRATSLSFAPRALAPEGLDLLVTGEKINLARFKPATTGFSMTASTTLGAATADYGAGLAVGSKRLLVGAFSGTQNLGGCQQGSAGWIDVFVGSYDPGFNCSSSIRIGGSGTETARGIAIDSSGNHAVIGETSGGLTLGSTPVPAGRIFVSARLPTGQDQWARPLGGGTANANLGYAIAYDYLSGRLCVAGSVGGAGIDLGDGPVGDSHGTKDLFVSCFLSSGAHHWSKHLGGSGADAEARAIAIGPSGVAVTGSFKGSVTLEAGVAVASKNRDVFVLLLKL